MKVILIIICLIVIFCLSIYRKDIDEKEKVALKTPSKALRLRQNYGEIVDLILKDPDHHIVFERSYDESIRFANTKNQELFISYSGLGSHDPQLHVACIQNSMVIKEWKFDKQRSYMSIYQEIADYFY